ncbi:MAG TPA: CHAD domain-containing protein, partial [Pyrinomonadaceae bacterium]|nr:CHAD domain-containing protein [Pyrinomonadaceae bacterium]
PASVPAVVVVDPDGLPARLNFVRAGREIVQARSAELRQLSASLYRPFDTEPLHRMRIAAKRLRYAVELYGQCFGERLRPFARKIAGLQKSLGELHDCDVWIEDLGARLAGRRDASHVGTGPNRRAAIWLLQHFVNERTRHYTDALSCWQGCEREDFFAHLIAAFDSPPDAPHEPRPEADADTVDENAAPPAQEETRPAAATEQPHTQTQSQS